MSEPLMVAVNKIENGTLMEVGGSLDGNAKLPDLGFVSGTLTINLFELIFINSLGIRYWINWIKTVQAENGIILTRCSTAFARQISILQNFIPNGVTVESICVPYFCVHCNREEQRLIHIATELDTLPSKIPCVICKADAEIDVIKSSYFKFWLNKTG